MRIEIVFELPFGDQHGVDELLELRVAGLGFGEYLADEVDRPLHVQHFSVSSRSTTRAALMIYSNIGSPCASVMRIGGFSSSISRNSSASYTSRV
jgi:hypothetical protein